MSLFYIRFEPILYKMTENDLETILKKYKVRMSNMNFNCDVCGREVQCCTFVNGMKFCAKCYQETFGETEKDRKIADLKRQLEEKEKTINNLIEDNKASNEWLKKQLEEKDNEIERIKAYNVALFASLYQILEKEHSENVSSIIDQLTAQNNSYTSDLYKCNKGYDRLDKALNLACEYMCKYDVPCPNNKCEQKQCLEDKKFCYYAYFKFKAMEELENE